MVHMRILVRQFSLNWRGLTIDKTIMDRTTYSYEGITQLCCNTNDECNGSHLRNQPKEFRPPMTV